MFLGGGGVSLWFFLDDFVGFVVFVAFCLSFGFLLSFVWLSCFPDFSCAFFQFFQGGVDGFLVF